MLRLRGDERLPAAHEERPAGPQHHGRRQHRAGSSSSSRAAADGRCRESARPCRGSRWARKAPRATHSRRFMSKSSSLGPWSSDDLERAPAPCRRSGRRPARPGGSPDAWGRCRSCLSACGLGRLWRQVALRLGRELAQAALAAEVIGVAACSALFLAVAIVTFMPQTGSVAVSGGVTMMVVPVIHGCHVYPTGV